MASEIGMEYTLDSMIGIVLSLSAEKDFDTLMGRILDEAMGICNSDAGTVYLKEEDHLIFHTVCTKSKGVYAGRNENLKIPPVPLDRHHVCSVAATDNKKINLPDIYGSLEYDFSGARRYDIMNDYHTSSMLVIPMADEKDEVIGVLQLINALDKDGGIIPFDPKYENVISALSCLAAVSINNHKLAQEISDLLHSFVSVMVEAIDTRSPYNANHTRNMVRYAERFLNSSESVSAGWEMDEGRKDAFLMSVWLHDIGKLLVPPEVLDKPDRLGKKKDRIKTKIEITRLKNELRKYSDPSSVEEGAALKEKLDRAWELIEKTNAAGFVDDDTIAALKEYALITCETEYGEREPLLNDEELEAITVRRGTLTAGERSEVEGHVRYTRKLLDKMGFKGLYKRVPFWAGSHHELLNGRGYPEKLSGDDIPKETRLLTIIDIYDALTAEDRPYKPPMPAEKAFSILESMAEEGSIDKELLRHFKESEAWKKPE